MRKNPPKFDRLSQMASIDVGRLTEDQARKILEDIRWPDSVVCVHCGHNKVNRLQTVDARDGLWQCYRCQKQFTVTVGTVMHGSHVTLRQWVQAFYSMCSHKKGISALQLQRNLGLGSYRSAWFLAHRIREAMKLNSLDVKIKSITGKPYSALLERGIYGTFHHVSKKHLSRYCDEFSFRWNHRESSDGERTAVALSGINGKRLSYKKNLVQGNGEKS